MQTDILLTIGERTMIVDTKYYTKRYKNMVNRI